MELELVTFKLGPIQEAWLQSLEQHPERQLQGALGKKNDDGSYKACCLGELGLIASLCEWSNNILHIIGQPGLAFTLSNIYNKVGLRGSNGVAMPPHDSLARLNDRGVTWPEIAAIVRANPESYFNESV